MNKLKIDKVPLKNIYETTYSIPIYQREYVWRKKNQVNLIESILNDYPVGAILVFRSNNRDQLIDGLQRVTTLQKFSENPKNIFKTAKEYTELEIVGEKISEMKENFSWINIENYTETSLLIDNLYNEWFNSLDKEENAQNNLLSFLENKSLKKIIKKYKLDNSEIIELHDMLHNTIDISYYLLPVMYYDGNDVDLPQIFENLNTNSVSLGKYDVYNSTWVNILVEFSKDDIECIKNMNEQRNTEIADSDEKQKLEGFVGSHGPIINNFRILHYKLSEVFSKVSDKKVPKSLYNLSFEIYSSLYSGDYNDIKSFVALFDKNFSLSVTETSRIDVGAFFSKLNSVILEVFEHYVNEIGVEVLKVKNRLLYLILTEVYKNYKIDFLTLSCLKRSEEQQNKIKTKTYKELIDDNWFIAENRQLSFFKEKSEKFLAIVYEAENNKKEYESINIEENGSLTYKSLMKVEEEEWKKIFEDKENYTYIELQNVNNEPYNKRIQNTKVVKQALKDGRELVSVYKICDFKYIKIEWKLSIEERNKFMEGENYSLKLNLQDFQHVYINEYKKYENKYMKYKAELTYVSLRD